MKENNPPFTAADLQLQTILDVSPVGLLVFSDQEDISTANPPAERFFGLPPKNESPLRYCNFTSPTGVHLP